MKIRGAVRALGAMSGTSLDGVDAAVIVTDGYRILEFGESAYRPYSEAERAILRAALGKRPGEPGVAEAAEVVEIAHAELLAQFQDVDIVGFHGQTLLHRPQERLTHQAGDGAVLAEALGLPVVWDFRSSDVGLGGQGAPLAPFYHWALARQLGHLRPMAFLNLGGVGNLSWVNPGRTDPTHVGACIAFDTGPANAPIDDLVQARRGLAFDEGGALASKGLVDQGIVSAVLADPYFHKMPPKSLDRNDFPDLLERVAELSDADASATLTAISAMGVVAGLAQLQAQPARVLVSGGGRKNALLMKMIASGTEAPVMPIEEAGFDGDMLEAQAFAFLAVRVARGWPTSAPGTTGIAAPVGGGRISEPGL